jgi:hypothetical protein
MTLSAAGVVDLQFFLMDAAKRQVADAGLTGELLAQAAALDYALLLSSEHGDEPIDDAAAVAALIRDTMTAAASAALDFLQAILAAPDADFAAFVAGHARPGGIFDTVRALRKARAIVDEVIDFRLVTLASEVAERRLRLGGTAL